MDHPTPKQIPEFIRLLLEPFKNVLGNEPIEPKQREKIETTLIPESSRPDDEALIAIGKVATAWSVMEHVLQIALARLALSTQYPVFALTSDLSMDNRLRAIKALIALHRQRYAYQLADEGIYDVLAKQLELVAALKGKRNQIVHGLWIKASHDPERGPALMPLKARPIPHPPESGKRSLDLEISEINKIAKEIQVTANGIFALAQILPEADESWLLGSLARQKRHPRSDAQSEHPPQPEPPQD